MPVPRPTALNIDEFEKSQIAIKTNKQTNKQTKNRPSGRYTWYEWYNWLINYTPESVKNV